MYRRADSAFERPLTRAVRITEVQYEADGELVRWAHLNADPDRCPTIVCDQCPKRCLCAPCRCAECRARDMCARGI